MSRSTAKVQARFAGCRIQKFLRWGLDKRVLSDHFPRGLRTQIFRALRNMIFECPTAFGRVGYKTLPDIPVIPLLY
jgi:hypothetical protein